MTPPIPGEMHARVSDEADAATNWVSTAPKATRGDHLAKAGALHPNLSRPS